MHQEYDIEIICLNLNRKTLNRVVNTDRVTR